MQLAHTIRPEPQFERYFYQSSISATMRTHLTQLAVEATDMLGARAGEICYCPRILDIGGNDGFLMDAIPVGTGLRTVIDPSDVPIAYPGVIKIKGFFPGALMFTRKYDLIFSIACFYDADDPMAFAMAVRKTMEPDGLWVVEVADLPTVLKNVAFDYFVSEHSICLSAAIMTKIAQESDLKIVRAEPNGCNGGSVRYYLTHRNSTAYDDLGVKNGWFLALADLWSDARKLSTVDYDQFAVNVQTAVGQLKAYVADAKDAGKTINVLGASTKLGLVLQYAKLTVREITAASDRDPRKVGRRMPGTGIPIISEDDSRAQKPDCYITVLPFKQEILDRERAAGNNAEIVSILPTLQVIR